MVTFHYCDMLIIAAQGLVQEKTPHLVKKHGHMYMSMSMCVFVCLYVCMCVRAQIMGKAN